MMRILIMLTAVGLIAGCATGYRRPILGMAGGYSDRKLGEGHWTVVFGTNAYSARGYALNAAIYRSAELARGGGYPFFRIVKSNMVVGSFSIGYGYAAPGGGHYGGEGVYLTVRGIRGRDAETSCENPDGRGCITLETDMVLRELEPVVKPKRKGR